MLPREPVDAGIKRGIGGVVRGRREDGARLVAAIVILVWLVAACSVAHGGTSNTASNSVTCTIATALEATFPTDLAMGEVPVGSSGLESAPQVTTVRSNAPWSVTVGCDCTGGRMREWNGTAYVDPGGQTLTNPLEWKNASGGTYAALSTTPATVVSNQPATPADGSPVSVKFRQVVGFADKRLGSGRFYRILVTYTAAHQY